MLQMSIIVNLLSLMTSAVSNLYWFGVSAGDFQLEREDDGSSSPISLSIPFRFFGMTENTLYVSWLLIYRAVGIFCRGGNFHVYHGR